MLDGGHEAVVLVTMYGISHIADLPLFLSIPPARHYYQSNAILLSKLRFKGVPCLITRKYIMSPPNSFVMVNILHKLYIEISRREKSKEKSKGPGIRKPAVKRGYKCPILGKILFLG